MHAPAELADTIAEVLARIRARAPRVHCITNTVAQAYTANMLLAAGAIPSMTIAPEEIGAFVDDAHALLVNLGTFDRDRKSAIELAVGSAHEQGVPWLLDPVFIERSPARAEFARSLLGRKPAVVRLNAKEFTALSDAEAGDEAAAHFAKAHGTVMALTGQVDSVTGERQRTSIANGDPLMGQVTAMGCAGSALVCAALAVETDPFIATVAALAAFGIAGEMAARQANGPGSFAIAIIDALHNLDRAQLRAHLRAS
ncbi:MAG TPA: hydroxyethylthiazole kinase [Xanthobacteraceae bacterium]|jgi:hydroxyethylthiazole kinase|nr:hydroxyethylthiazole kinase [Xanthobacteraceae bacterium]